MLLLVQESQDFVPADVRRWIRQHCSGLEALQRPALRRGKGWAGQPIPQDTEADGIGRWPNPSVSAIDTANQKHESRSIRRDDVQAVHLEVQNSKPNDLTAEPMLGKKSTPIGMSVGQVLARPKMVLDHFTHFSEPSGCHVGAHVLCLRNLNRILPCEHHDTTALRRGTGTVNSLRPLWKRWTPLLCDAEVGGPQP